MMINHKSPSCTSILFAVLAVPLLLVACGESTNLRDPKQIVSTTDCSELASAEGVTCIPGYFIDDVVENLNYSCGKVNSVTDETGRFSCPAASKVEFAILNPDDASDTAKKIVLGELMVKSLPKIYSRDAAIYVTPMSFGSQNATNITRLLQTLRSPDATLITSPSRTIKLLDADKKKLGNLSASIDAANFALTDPVAFEGLFTTYLTSLPRAAMISVPDAEIALKKGVHSTIAGAYSVPAYTFTYGYHLGNKYGDGDLGGIRGINTANYLLAATWNVIDRKGRITGFGVYSTESATLISPNTCKSMFPASTCSPMPALNVMYQKNPSGLNWTPWDVTASKWGLSYELLNSSGGTTNNIFSFVQGAVDRGAVAGTPYVYSQIYGESVAESSSLLGKWSITAGSPNFNMADTSYTVVRTRGVAPTLDPLFWGGVTFPLKVRMNFLKGDKASSIGVLRVLILEDGNIVSNIQEKCNVASLDRDTLTYPDSSKEFPLGTVAQIFSANNDSGKRRYMAPIMLIPDDALSFGALSNIQIGIASGSSAGVRLRVDTESSSAYLRTYSDTEFDSSGNARDQDSSAQWLNAVGGFRTLTTGAGGYVTSQADTGPCS